MAKKPSYEELEQRVTELERVVESIGDGICIIDAEFRILYENKTHRDAFGEHTGEYCYAAYHNKNETCDECPVALVFKNGKSHTRERMVQEGEKVAYYEVAASPITYSRGGVTAVIESVRNITERRRAEESLAESEEKFRSIIERLPMGIHMYEMDSDGQLRFIDANPAADRILGTDNKLYIGKTIEEAFPEVSKTEIPGRFQAIAEEGGF